MATKSPQVYISSSLQIYDINADLDRHLRSNGISVFLPQRDCGLEWLAKQPVRARQVMSKEAFEAMIKWVFTTDIRAIASSNALVAIARKLGKDSAFECGYSRSAGIDSILIIDEGTPLPFDHHNSFSTIVRIGSYSKQNLAVAAEAVSKLLRGLPVRETPDCKVIELREAHFEKTEQVDLKELDLAKRNALRRLRRFGIHPELRPQLN